MIALFDWAAWIGITIQVLTVIADRTNPDLIWRRGRGDWTWKVEDEVMNRALFPDQYLPFKRILEFESMKGWPEDQRKNPIAEHYKMSDGINSEERLFYEKTGRVILYEGDQHGHLCYCLYELTGAKKRIFRLYRGGSLVT